MTLRGKKNLNKEYNLKIIACIKQVPDSEAKVKAEGGQVSWGDAPLVINPRRMLGLQVMNADTAFATDHLLTGE